MKKNTLILAVLILAALACTTVEFPGFSQTQPPADVPNAMATILADPAYQETKNAPTQIPVQPTNTPVTSTDQKETPTAQPEITSTPEMTATSSGFPTAIPLPNPKVSDFTTCLSECLASGSNHQTSFPVKTEIIYFRFEFEEFPYSAPYSRVWYKDGAEWVRYNCYWPGPESGVEEITLTDPLGLPSGTWNVVITINGVQVLDETLKIEGSWNQWSPPGYFNSCYGKR